MAKKQKQVICPVCGNKLMTVCHCKDILLRCFQCGSSMLADVEEDGSMRLSIRPGPDLTPQTNVAI